MRKKILLHPNFIMIISIISGYLAWGFITEHKKKQQVYSIPICFYPSNTEQIVVGPEYVTCLLQGSIRNMDYRFDPKQSVVHVDISSYKAGVHYITLSKEQLFLPCHLEFIQFIPSTIKISIGNTHNESTK